jgi:hypothetical protein
MVTNVNKRVTTSKAVMPALVAGIRGLRAIEAKDVDGRDKPGHDERRRAANDTRRPREAKEQSAPGISLHDIITLAITIGGRPFIRSHPRVVSSLIFC